MSDEESPDDQSEASDGDVSNEVPEPVTGVENYGSEELSRASDEGHIDTHTSIEEDPDGNPVVTRSAAFAEVADRPREKALDAEDTMNEVEFLDNLRKFDPELAGTIRAMCQSAAAGIGVIHPAEEGKVSEMSDIEEKITDACDQLLDDLGIREEATTYFRNCVVHGDDMSHIHYDEGDGDEEGGVEELTPLPLRLMTVTDERPPLDGTDSTTNDEDFDRVIAEANYYAMQEDDDERREVYPARDVLHIALNRRGNWQEDILGRETFNVYGETTLEPVKFSVQTKQNTMANKVAMDDKLLTREYYHINVEELFGHIQDPDLRQRRVEEYAAELREKLEDLEADQKPIIPEEVTVEIEGPDGNTAQTMTDFIETMNNSIQHALCYHVASFGRDAGGTDRGNRPAKEMSDNTVRQLRGVVQDAFQRLFEIHAKLRFEEAREPGDGDGHEQYELDDDIVLPTLKFDPVDPEDRNDEVRNAATLYEKGIGDLNEARGEVNLKPIDEEEKEDMMFFKNPTTPAEDEEQRQEEMEMEMEQQGPSGDGDRESPNDEPTESRPSRTDSTDS